MTRRAVAVLALVVGVVAGWLLKPGRSEASVTTSGKRGYELVGTAEGTFLLRADPQFGVNAWRWTGAAFELVDIE